MLLLLLQSISHVRLFCNPMDCSLPGCPLSMGFSRQDYWNGLPFPSPRDLPGPGMASVAAALAGRVFTTEPPGRPQRIQYTHEKKEQDPQAKTGKSLIFYATQHLSQGNSRGFPQTLITVSDHISEEYQAIFEHGTVYQQPVKSLLCMSKQFKIKTELAF